ncbi:MAG: galactokinase family protein [Actinomycetaceae bacterium]|nr:galactokinase family protein [Actinomycetaceae bacterium]
MNEPELYVSGPKTGAINIASRVSTPDALPTPADSVEWYVPGRIEVLGKHTDYAGGRSLLATVDRGITVKARKISAPLVRLRSTAVNQEVTLPLSADCTGTGWGTYPATVISRLVRNFDGIVGADIEIDSTLPLASGMSSSSALVVGIARALIDLSGIATLGLFRRHVRDYESLAAYLACIENGMSFGELTGARGVGTFGGSEDHTAMLCCEAGKLAQYSFSPVRRERFVPIPAGHSFVIAVSGVLAEKTGAAKDAYNRASLAVSELLHQWNEATGRSDEALATALTSSEDAYEFMQKLAGEDTYQRRRLDQFFHESAEIIPTAADALVDGALDAFGELVDTSQKLAETHLGNQVPETITLTRLARRIGAVASSAFGAGFGGSVWALVPTRSAEDFAAEWKRAYTREFPHIENAQTIFANATGRARRLSRS